MFATQVLSEDLSENIEKEADNVEIVGFILINDGRYEIKKGETKIGRDPTVCSIVIENFTVSKVHAVIESEGIEDTFIYDAKSTNQTKLGKKTLKPHCRYKLEDGSSITFGNITARFTLPLKIRENSETKSNLDNFKASNGLEDIFDVVTQVTVPQPHTSGKILQFDKEQENFQIFKIPDLDDAEEKVKKSFGSSKDSVEVTQHQDLVSKTEYYNSSYKTSGIFSLSTQYQTIQSRSSKESESEDKVSSDNHRNNEPDSVKALLDDDHDSVLCTFMSLHSPGGQASSELPKKIKTEVTQEDYSQLFDVQTQVQAVLIQSRGKKNVEQASQFKEDLCSQNSPKPTTCSSQFDDGTRTKLNLASVASGKFNILIKDTEDFIKSQEFKSNPPVEECRTPLHSGPVVNNAPQESDPECCFEKTLNLSISEGLPENEDLICTQKFEVLLKGIQETTGSAPENEELNESNEDFMETQLYDFEKEQNSKGPEDTAGKPSGVAFVVSESPEKDSEAVEVNTDFTQRNTEEDFISTQAFSEMNQNRNADVSNSESSERTDDDYNDEEDFIATQPVDLLPSSTTKTKCFQEAISVRAASRESSPDLLDSGSSVKTTTDFMRSKTSSSELLEEPDSLLLSNVKKELNEDINIFPMKSVDRIESSGEETESDLEIIFDKSNTSKIRKVGEFSDKTCNAESQQPENNTTARSSGVSENNDSSSSYIFQLEHEAPEAREDFASIPTPTRQNIVSDQGRTAESDSDATDYEDIAVVDHEVPIKQELPRKITSDETKSTLTPPSKVSAPDDGCKDNKGSPSFEIGNENDFWSQLSLEMPATQDMERTVNKILHNKDDTLARDSNPKKEADYQTPSKILKTEVKTETFGSGSIRSKPKRQVDSPLKRPGNSTSEIEAVPPKKSKNEASDRKLRSSDKQFLKLWQVHDIEQIQPCKTRSSLKTGVSENKSNKTDLSLRNNISNKFATSHRETSAKKNTRKLSFDMIPHLRKKVENNKKTFLEGRKKEISPEKNDVEPKPVECCHRVLRSSSRNNGNILPPWASEYPAKQALNRSRRNSRLKTENYFSNPCVNVIFTGFDCESLEKIIFNLGGKKTNDLSLGEVVVADKVRRTVKFLSAIALSLPITSPQWLLACRSEKKFLNPWDFILRDEESERKWGFELKTSLERSKNVKLMQGMSVFATPSARPPVKDLMAIVKYCGGTPLFEPPHTWPKKTVIVSCPEDKRCWPLAKFRNIKIVHYEFILIGVLRQQLDFKTYKLR